ncbi:nucleoside diphosphate-linked moiety X motif 8 isoform X1 [Epinephelus moara]|uniref:nucleoside diphosphate-linked moiety X motif 8 isoform X1 n=1 Tax=Epinephelus moara TaxID=300413 RepID=UPI00214F6018|nr:nucleoside diphosphate-linked moiety X motif 8 isoform X1 [Epinephelus moara]
MFRAPQVLIWSCPTRPLLLLRESHLSAFCKHTAAGWQGSRDVKQRRYEGICGSKEGSSLSTETASRSTQLSSSNSGCDNLRRREFQNHPSNVILSSHHHSAQVFAAAKARRASDFWKCTVAEDLGLSVKAASPHQDCLINTTCLQPWERPWDVCQPSLRFTNKTRCNLQSHLYCRQYFVRPFSSSTHTACVSNHFHSRQQHSSNFSQINRAVHQAAPCIAEAWRDCLSLENENRCRQSLGPNLKLYEVDKGKKGASQSQGKNQGRWASVLVSLCSVEGEPAFLFTLRSSTLKGRHKGDVSFAGGKSDPSDRDDVVVTALREAREELGVSVAAEKVWGLLKPLRDRSGMLVAPVLANLGPIEELSFKPNPGEVEEIFTLSLSHLCNPQNRGYTHFRVGDKYGYTLPVFCNGKHRVWGLTAVALDHTLKLIVPS